MKEKNIDPCCNIDCVGGGDLRKEIVKILFPGMSTLYINTSDIGPRLYIQHGFSTIISAKKIGSNCWINQQVTR